MRIANLDGRLVLLLATDPKAHHGNDDDRALDVERASGGRFGPSPHSAFDDWADFCDWAADADPGAARPYDPSGLGPPAPAPRQIFAVGLNYRGHAAETGQPVPAEPPVFTKFASSLTGPDAQVQLRTPSVDWEVELVAVVGRPAHRVRAADAWHHIAGLTVAQDLSDRTLQLSGSPAQFSLGKSFAGFAPTGPYLVSTDQLADPDDLEIGCSLNGVTVQKGRTSDMVFALSELVEYLSAVVTLLPEDLIFTGTPAGVGHGRTPPQYLRPGDELVSWVKGLGELRTRFSSGPPYAAPSR